MMIIRKSLLSLLRTPVRTILFFLLVGFASALLATGGGLWQICSANLLRFESIFQTIGTVEQKPERYVRGEMWQADNQSYRIYNKAEYGDIILPAVLDFEGADYLNGPEKRAWYAAYLPEYEMLDEGVGGTQVMVVEASPTEDAVPAGPIKMEIRNILYTYYPYNAPNFYFCDHFNPSPEKMYADKTYIMCISDWIPHGYPEATGPYEYIPAGFTVSSTQAGSDGIIWPNELSGNDIAEVTPGFYETDEGRHWQALIQELEMGIRRSVPVTATQNTDLIPAFYDGSAYVDQGREFMTEDYREGHKVCLVNRKFAKRNDLQVGDILHLPLRYADYSSPSEDASWNGALTAQGEVFSVFEEGDWEICGIYDMLPGASAKSIEYQLNENEIIIPKSSIQNSDEDHISAWGRMEGWNTSFEIPNGSIEHWKELWEKQGIDGLEITFYDKGYTILEDGIRRMRKMALILLVAGAVSTLCILLFFCHMFITKQSVGTAVERSLGMNKRQCAGTLLSGILLIVLCGCILGSAGGYVGAVKTAGRITQVERFDRNYSAGMMHGNGEEEITYILAGDWRVSAITGTAVLMTAVGIAAAMIGMSLRREPLALLSGREE